MYTVPDLSGSFVDFFNCKGNSPGIDNYFASSFETGLALFLLSSSDIGGCY